MRRLLIICLLSMIIFPLNHSPINAKEQKPSVSAQAAILMDAKTGRVLYAKEAEKSTKIASLTKIMTAIVAIEEGKLDDLVTIRPSAVGVEGSSIYLKAGEKIPLETLLYGLMLRSGNDAAVAIAEHIGGSVEGFVYLMNEKAAHLGLKQTRFMNPHGLDHADHYSSAKDLAVFTSYALKNPAFQKIVQTQVKDVPWPGEKWKRKFHNKNKLLRMYEQSNGVKTGYTKQAGRTLVTSATKNGRQLVAVTLNAPNDWQDHTNLFDFGFSKYIHHSVLEKGETVIDQISQAEKGKQLKIVTETKFDYPLVNGEQKNIVLKPILTHPPQLIQKAGLKVGSLQVFVKDRWIGSVPLISKWHETSNIWSVWKRLMGSVLTTGGVNHD